MKQKVYTLEGKEYRQGVMSVEQIKAFLKLLKEVGLAQLVNAGAFDLSTVFDQIIEQDKIELFLAIVLLPKEQAHFGKNSYDKNLQEFGLCSGEILAEVMEDFLSCNEPWFTRLGKQMEKMKAPAGTTVSSTSTN